MTVAIVTDSVATIPDELIESLGICWVPYYIHRGTEVLRDLVTVTRQAFYEWLPAASELPKTASPGPGDYVNTYRQLAESGVREIASIHMTSKGSGAYQAALAAKSMMLELIPDLRIEVIDTLNASMCQGWMVIEAARASLEGKSLSDVVKVVKRMMPVTKMIQTADTLKYLYMGGRIGGARRLVGSILNIKPLIGMEEGIIVALGTTRSRSKAYARMAEMVESAVGHMGKIKVAYVHAAALEEVDRIRQLVEDRLTCVESLIAELPPALGVHTGPGTAGLCYFPVLVS